jgi:hypothetical protein
MMSVVPPNRPSRGPGARKPLSPQRNPSGPACPERAKPRHVLLHASFAGRRGGLGAPPAPRAGRSRLRHDTHRRGDASAASRPLKAHARVVEKVCLSAQPPADRSVQRLMQRRHWTAPAHRWAARRHSCPPSARQRARMDAAPCLPSLPPKGPGGRHRRRCALPVRLIPLAPHPPRGFCQLLHSPAGRPPRGGSHQGRHGGARRASVLADLGRRHCACRGTGGARSCRTRRGRGLACSVVAACPHTPRRSLRSAVGRTVFYCRAVCCRAPVAGACSFP